MRNARLIYKKTSRAKYISHLDMNRLMLRIIKRSKLPIWYTEGFNPHAFITFALPLSLGFESDYDIMDFKIADDELSFEEATKMIREVMPDTVQAIKIVEPVMNAKELKFASFKIDVVCDNENSLKLKNLLNADEIVVEKMTKKKKLKTFNFKEKIKVFSVLDIENGFELSICLPAGSEENINPMLFFETAEKQGFAFEIERVLRVSLFDKNMALFH